MEIRKIGLVLCLALVIGCGGAPEEKVMEIIALTPPATPTNPCGLTVGVNAPNEIVVLKAGDIHGCIDGITKFSLQQSQCTYLALTYFNTHNRGDIRAPFPFGQYGVVTSLLDPSVIGGGANETKKYGDDDFSPPVTYDILKKGDRGQVWVFYDGVAIADTGGVLWEEIPSSNAVTYITDEVALARDMNGNGTLEDWRHGGIVYGKADSETGSWPLTPRGAYIIGGK